MRKTGILRSGTAKFFAPLSHMKEEGRPPMLWRRMFFHSVKIDIIETLAHLRQTPARFPGGHETVCRALGISYEKGDGDDAARLVLNSFGVTATRILRGSKQWSFPDSKTEGEDAIIVPVGGRCAPMAECLSLLGTHELMREADADAIGDLIAIPLSDGKPLSFNLTTVAIGAFSFAISTGLRNGEQTKTVRIATNGLAWLRRHVVRARTMAEGWPAHLVARKLPPPDRSETLLLDESAFSWRLEHSAHPWPAGTRAVICPDSAELASFIATELKRRDRLPPSPQVLGPRA